MTAERVRPAAAGAVHRTLPLRNRLANPPPLFTGRTRDSDALRAAVERAPVSVVWGGGGIGKTALVLATMATHFRRRVARTIHVALRPGDPVEHIGLEVLRAVAVDEPLAGSGGEWSAALRDRQALIAMTIDAVEAARLWVVVDDLHNVDSAGAQHLLQGLARYARASRWIVTSRADPGIEELAGQVLALDRMPAVELEALASRLAPDADAPTIRRAVAACEGSPLLLTPWLAQFRVDPAAAALHWVEAQPEAVIDLLRTLSIVEVALPSAVLLAISEQSGDALGRIERVGGVERSEAGWRLHDAARLLVRDATTGATIQRYQRRAADVLVGAADPSAVLDGLRLHLALGRIEESAALLDRRGLDLVRQGYAAQLFGRLGAHHDLRLDRWRLRSAVEWGAPEAIGSVREPSGPSNADRILWARALLLRGDSAGAAERADEVAKVARTTGDAALAFEAGELRALCLANEGRAAEAFNLLCSLEPHDPDSEAVRDGLGAAALGALGRAGEARAYVDRVRRKLPQLRSATGRRLRYTLASALQRVGHIEDAIEIIEPLIADLGAGRFVPFWGAVLWLRAGLALERADLPLCESLLDRLAPFGAGPSILRSYLVELRVELDLAAGRLEGIERRIDDLDAIAREQAHLHVQDSATLYRLEHALLRALSTNRASSRAETARSSHAMGSRRALWEIRHRLRFASDVPRVPSQSGDAPVGDRVLAQIVDAEIALVTGDYAAGQTHADAAVQLARKHGQRLREADALQTSCVAAIALDREVALRSAAGSLVDTVAGSARWTAESRFWSASADRVPAPAVLAALARMGNVAPVAARRARALLGDGADLDALDRIVVDAIRRRALPWAIEPAPGDPAVAWGLDQHRKQVWLPDGRTIDLSSRPVLWAMLTAVEQGGGAATSERLARELWQAREYHRFRHGNRLQGAVRNVRHLLEDDPKVPKRLVTVADGYAFGLRPALLRRS